MLGIYLSLVLALAPSERLSPSDDAGVVVGAQVLVKNEFAVLAGKRVGLITNHTARVGGRHLADLLHADERVNLVALYAPEHGIRGTGDAGAHISTTVDEAAGLAVHSLHGDTYKPTREMLEGVEVLLFDMQDVGTRFYTYISTLGLAMQAAADAEIEFVVLDRPNPIGGELVEGFVLERQHKSFIGMYEIPVTHGMTIGEIALMIKGLSMLEGLEELELHVVQMEGWRRDMIWPDTGLEWIPPSPNLPSFESAVVYPGACFFGSTSASEGRGTLEPFILVGAPWTDAPALAAELNGRELPGLWFEPASFTPRSIDGMSTSPKLKGIEVHGIRHVVTDARAVRPVEVGVHTLQAFYEQAPEGARDSFFVTQPMLNVSGTDRLYRMIEAGASPDEIVDAWQDDVGAFRSARRPFLLYD